jgi:O-antigen ligase
VTALRRRGPPGATWRRRRGAPATAWLLVPLVICAGFGVISGISPKYGVFGALGLGFVVAVFADLVLGIAIFAALSFLDVLTIGGAALSFDKVAGLLLFTAWIVSRTTAPRAVSRDILARHPAMFASIAAFLGWTTISALWAFDSGAAFETAYRDLLEILLIPIVYSAVRHRRDVYTIVVGYLVGAGFSAIYGLAAPAASTSAAAGRLVGSLGEANQQATVLVAGLALAMGLWIVARHSPRIRAVAIGASALSVIGLLTTLSRAGLIAFGFVLVGGVIFGGRWRRPAAVVLIAVAAGVTGYFVALAPPSAVQRITSGDTSGRNDIWKVGWRMFEANPVLGVGAGNFQLVSSKYLQRPGLVVSANDFLISPKVAHNIYLEQLSTLGVPGLLMMLGIFVAGLASALRAAHIFERLGDRELELMSRCAILALIAFMSADFFASELLSKQLWLVFALGPALLKLARIQLQEATA